MKANAKYLFDEDFASGEKPTISLVEAERRRADAESQAYRQGFTAGQEQARGEIAQQIAIALAAIGESLKQTRQDLTGIEARLESEAVQVAVAVAQKLAPELLAREPLTEISALATDCFRHLVTTPHISVRICGEIYDAARLQLEEIAQSRGFDGRLIVVQDDALAVGDCRIEWADGGITRDREAIQATMDELVGRYMEARQ